MFKRLKTWLVVCAERYQQWEIERLHEECCRLKEELMKLNGGESIPLSPEQCRLLADKAKGIDPEVLKQICVRDFQDFNPLGTNRATIVMDCSAIFVLVIVACLSSIGSGLIYAQDASDRPWFESSIVGMEVGPTGAQFGYSDPTDDRYCKKWDGREIVKKCVEANAEYLVLWRA